MPTPTTAPTPSSPSQTPLRPRTLAALLLLSIILLGTLLSHLYTLSQPELLVTLQLPSTPTASFWMNKHNPFNALFVKYAWGWTSLAFLLHWLAAPAHPKKNSRWVRYALATLAFWTFTAWFFGPAGMDRLRLLSGGECVLPLPISNPPTPLSTPLPGAELGTKSTQPLQHDSLYLLQVPTELCYTHLPLSPQTHPELFTADPLAPAPPAGFSRAPRIRKGHDTSGHIFLLTLAVLFLVDEVALSWAVLYARFVRREPEQAEKGRRGGGGAHVAATAAVTGLLGLWVWMVGVTSVFFHTPEEKLSGYLIGLGAYAFSQIPVPFVEGWLEGRA